MTGKGRTTLHRWVKGEVAPTAATETRLGLDSRVW